MKVNIERHEKKKLGAPAGEPAVVYDVISLPDGIYAAEVAAGLEWDVGYVPSKMVKDYMAEVEDPPPVEPPAPLQVTMSYPKGDANLAAELDYNPWGDPPDPDNYKYNFAEKAKPFLDAEHGGPIDFYCMGGCGLHFWWKNDAFHWECGSCWGCSTCGSGVSSSARSREILDQWGLPYELNVALVAADFYTYYRMSLAGYKPELLVAFLDEYLPIIRNYTDMVIGGELRHLNKHDRYGLVKDKPLGGARHQAWEKWHGLRIEHGANILRDARDSFNSMGAHGSVGSKPWGNIADVLLAYEEGNISSVLFMDFAFGLEHNGGRYFNKIGGWKQQDVKRVLDANLADDPKGVARFASVDAKGEFKCFST